MTSQDNKRRILAVDDDPDITRMLKMALEHVGFSIDAFNDPVLAPESFKPKLYGLVILDDMMQKLNGLQSLQRKGKILESPDQFDQQRIMSYKG